MDDLSLNYDVEETINALSRKFGITKAKVRAAIMRNNNDIPPTTPNRALYNFFRSVYPANVPLPMSHLRADALLTNNTEIIFVINQTGGTTPQPVERRLPITNTFEVLEISLRIYKIATSTTSKQTAKLYTYVNPFIFNGGGGTEAAALQSIFTAGQLQYRLDNEILYPAIDCNRFEVVPTTQEGTVTAVDNAGVVFGRQQRDGVEKTSNFIENIPSNTLNGNGQNTYLIKLPEAVNMAGTGSTENWACLVLRGFEGISGTKQANRKVSV